jgi:hypothetical protein
VNVVKYVSVCETGGKIKYGRRERVNKDDGA